MGKIRVDRSILFLRLYIFLTIFSIAGHALSDWRGIDPGVIAPISAGMNLILGLLVLFGDGSGLASALWIFVLGALVELVGLRTGWPFGRYHYTDVWQPIVDISGIGRFPLLLPLAWSLVVGASAGSAMVLRPRFLAWVVAAGLATTLDLAMESVLAGKMGYWKWDSPGPLMGGSPWSNSVSWFVLSLLGSAFLVFGRNPEREEVKPNRGAIAVLLGQFALMLGLWIA